MEVLDLSEFKEVFTNDTIKTLTQEYDNFSVLIGNLERELYEIKNKRQTVYVKINEEKENLMSANLTSLAESLTKVLEDSWFYKGSDRYTGYFSRQCYIHVDKISVNKRSGRVTSVKVHTTKITSVHGVHCEFDEHMIRTVEDIQRFLTDLDKKGVEELPSNILSLNVLSQALKNNGSL